MYPPTRTLLCLAGVLSASPLFAAPMTDASFSFEALPPLPPFAGQSNQPGLAGPYAGVSNGALILGGGANFPDQMPWRDGVKKTWGLLRVLEKTPEGPRWVTPEHGGELPRPMAYGASATTPGGVVCAGGADALRCYDDVFLLRWDKAKRSVLKRDLPPLPRPLAMMGAALAGGTIYLAGGCETVSPGLPTCDFWALDLTDPNARWRELPAWDGPARILPVLAELGGRIYLFSGRTPAPGAPTQILTDAYCFNPVDGRWTQLTDVDGRLKNGEDGCCVMAGAAWKSGDEILIFGGARGACFMELEGLSNEIARLRPQVRQLADPRATQARIDALNRKRFDILEKTHPGFAREILAYRPADDTWRVAGLLPQGGAVTTVAVPWEGGILIPNGEIRPGVRTPDLLLIKPR